MNTIPAFRRRLPLLLLCACLLLAVLPAPRAAAASGSVKVTDGGYGDYPTDWYWVSTPDREAGLPTFASSPVDDVFVNTETGEDARLTFYRPYEVTNEKEAGVLLRYVNKTGAAFAFHFYDTVFSSETWCVCTVAGPALFGPDLDPDELVNRNPWVNGRGLQMYIYHIGSGDLVVKGEDYIFDVLGCSFAVYLPHLTDKGGDTFGFAFYDMERDDPLVKRYCPEMYWY